MQNNKNVLWGFLFKRTFGNNKTTNMLLRQFWPNGWLRSPGTVVTKTSDVKMLDSPCILSGTEFLISQSHLDCIKLSFRYCFQPLFFARARILNLKRKPSLSSTHGLIYILQNTPYTLFSIENVSQFTRS